MGTDALIAGPGQYYPYPGQFGDAETFCFRTSGPAPAVGRFIALTFVQ